MQLFLIPPRQFAYGGCWVLRLWPRPHLMLNEGAGPLALTWCRDTFRAAILLGRFRVEVLKCPGSRWTLKRI
jgi:hypothetical protein